MTISNLGAAPEPSERDDGGLGLELNVAVAVVQIGDAHVRAALGEHARGLSLRHVGEHLHVLVAVIAEEFTVTAGRTAS